VLNAVPAVLYLARSAEIPADGESIQLFPPGVHKIVPSNADPKAKPKAVELTIDAATAEILEAKRAEYQAAADKGEGDAPYLDFNHDDQAAAAWPKRIFWGGDDPLLGGVRAEVEWSSAGEEAVRGKTYRRVSPAFYAPNGRVTGAPVNMGGLVNRAAFTKIQPLFAKENTQSPISNNQSTTMSEEEIAALKEENAALKTQLTEMQAQLDSLTTAAKAAAEKDAENTVAMAAKEGRIGTSEELQAKWKAQIIANPDAKELLLALPANPALTGTIIKAKASDPNQPADEKEEPKTLEEIIHAKRHAKADAQA
jgi:hypothetical protein